MTREEACRRIEQLYESWYPELLRYSIHLSGSHDLAEDAAQEAFLTLYREYRKGSEIANPRGYTVLAVKNQIATGFHRRRAHGEVGLPAMMLDSLQSLEVPPDRAMEASEELDSFLAMLTPREVEVVLLRLKGMKYKEIAAELGLSRSSVNTLLARAMRRAADVPRRGLKRSETATFA